MAEPSECAGSVERRECVLLINVLGKDMNVFQRGVDVGMAHEFHQGRQPLR
jgi:hypothetical protein